MIQVLRPSPFAQFARFPLFHSQPASYARSLTTGIAGRLATGLASLSVIAAGPALALNPPSPENTTTHHNLAVPNRTNPSSQHPAHQRSTYAPSDRFEMQAMYRELENLAGRIESRYLFERSRHQPVQLRAVNPSLTVSNQLNPTIPTPLPAELHAAQQLLHDWPALIRTGQSQIARDRWQTVTQSLQNISSDSGTPNPDLLASSIAQPAIRAIWLDRETIVEAGSRRGLAKVFERMKSAGINTIFVETVNAGYPIYPSEVAPEQNPLIQGWDPLQAAVELGQAYNMEVHAWVWIFAASNQAHNPLVGQPADYPGPILSARPDWAGYDRNGNLIIPGQTKTFLDPANPEVRQYLFDLLGEIADRYAVNGIQLDYIRYPFQDASADRVFGYGSAARAQFKQLTGIDPIELSPQSKDQRLRYLWNQWTAFRMQQVTSFVAEASQRLRRQRGNLTLSTAVFADDTHKRQHTIQQDWEDWADQGLVDWIVLMSYARDTRQFEQLVRPWTLESSYRNTLVIPGIRLLNLPTNAALDQLQLLSDLATSGYALFAADNLNGDMQAVLAQAQGHNQDQPLAETDATPIAIAATHYRSLQQEWNWLLTNQQLRLNPQQEEQWIRDVNQLGTALNALTRSSTDRDIERDMGRVQAQLSRLQNTLARSLTVTATSPAYRLRTWQNRLKGIERLVAYGQSAPETAPLETVSNNTL